MCKDSANFVQSPKTHHLRMGHHPGSQSGLVQIENIEIEKIKSGLVHNEEKYN